MLRQIISAAFLLTVPVAVAAQTITCSVLPPVYYFDTASYVPTGEIQVGEARLYPVWAVNADAKIPDNRVTWAMAIAHAHQLFVNTTGTDKLPLNTYFGTPLKESFCGCDSNIIADPQSQFPLTYQAASDDDGCFQIEGPGSAYAELTNLYPQRFPANGHPLLVAGPHFETAALSKAYYDLFAVRYLDLSRNWDPIGFASQASDSLAFLKAMLAAYNRGLWDPLIQSIFQTNRPQALSTSDLHVLFPSNSVVLDYSTNITNYVLTLSNNVAALPVSLQNSNTFYGYYDVPVTMTDLNNYLDIIFPMYPDADTAQVRLRAQHAFLCTNGGSPISFRYQFGTVLDAIILNLPVDDPGEHIVISYGCNNVWPDTSWVPNYLPNLQAPNYADCYMMSVNGNSSDTKKGIFPNPAVSGNAVTISGEGEEYIIYDATGQICLSGKLAGPGQYHSLALPALAPGLYHILIRGEGFIRNEVLVITSPN